MKAPIIINENGDVSFFRTVEAAARALEPIDVRNQEYVAYDSEGYLLRLVPTDPTVVVVDGEESEPRAEQLAEIIRDFFSRVGLNQEWIRRASLSDLVSEGVKNYGSE